MNNSVEDWHLWESVKALQLIGFYEPFPYECFNPLGAAGLKNSFFHYDPLFASRCQEFSEMFSAGDASSLWQYYAYFSKGTFWIAGHNHLKSREKCLLG